MCVDADIAHEFWQLSQVKKIHHTGTFDSSSYDNDIAILELEKDLFLNDNIQRVCLPEKQFGAGQNCFVSGWGHDET